MTSSAIPPAAPHPDSETTWADVNAGGKRVPFGRLTDPATLDLSVIVPAYNEEERLPKMLDETLSYLRSKLPNNAYEVIVVDDGSKDGTIYVVEDYMRNHSEIPLRLLRMQRNGGKGAAVRTGMLAASGRKCLMVDADAATVFEEVDKLNASMNDVAVGSRVHLRTTKRDMLRSLVSYVFHLLVVLIGGVKGVEDTQCGFKLYSRRAARAAFIGQKLSRWAFDVENLYRVQMAGMKVEEVPVRWTEVPGSKLSVVKATLNMAWDMCRMRYHYVSGSWSLPNQITPNGGAADGDDESSTMTSS